MDGAQKNKELEGFKNKQLQSNKWVNKQIKKGGEKAHPKQVRGY